MNEETRAFITALFERIVPGDNGLYVLEGPIGPSEYEALRQIACPAGDLSPRPSSAAFVLPSIELDRSLLEADPADDGRICIDFGTAASKIGFEPEGGYFEPLEIGTADGGDPFWVPSAIAIDADRRMVFGKSAKLAGEAGLPVLTSFKSKLWGDPAALETTALQRGGISFSYQDCVQAYLAFLTFLGVQKLEEKGVSRWTPRRYAMPFAYDEQRRHIREALGLMLGRAAIMADTLGEELLDGVEAARMRAALEAVEQLQPPEWLLAAPGCVGEPVAAGAFAMDEELNKQTVYMIVDVGAGTTDFCILCLKKRADGDLEPLQIRDGALSLEVAGDAVDAALVEFLVDEQAGEDYRARLMFAASGIKEQLFAATATEDEQVDYGFADGFLVNINRRDFLNSAHWAAFEERLRVAQALCFDRADRGYLQNYGGGAIRVVLTGGGSALPLRNALADGRSQGEVLVSRVFAPDFPVPIQNRFATILPDLPRLAVSLGGSRDLLPDDFDRSNVAGSSGFTPEFVFAPFDKTKAGIDPDEIG